jgi:hypothetical protein
MARETYTLSFTDSDPEGFAEDQLVGHISRTGDRLLSTFWREEVGLLVAILEREDD